ncbi:putative sensor-like histidine kinase YedV [compost metagenome]
MKSVRIHLEEEGAAELVMNKDLAAVLISNLLKNAITHNVSGGLVKVFINGNSLVISNTGGPGALNQEKIFKRFQKDSREQSSIGLGLAIVKAIVDLYGFNIRYFYTDEHHIQLNFK